jgi:hypothetical protein
MFSGLSGAVAAGVRRASTAGAPLTAVLLPVVAAMLLVSAVPAVTPGGGRAVIVDGMALSLAVLLTVGLVAARLLLSGVAWAVAARHQPVRPGPSPRKAGQPTVCLLKRTER